MNEFIEGKIIENNSETEELTLDLKLIDLEDYDNVECLFVNYL